MLTGREETAPCPFLNLASKDVFTRIATPRRAELRTRYNITYWGFHLRAPAFGEVECGSPP